MYLPYRNINNHIDVSKFKIEKNRNILIGPPYLKYIQHLNVNDCSVYYISAIQYFNKWQ